MKNLDIRERVTQAQAAVLSDFQVEIPKIGLIRAMKTYPAPEPVMNPLTGAALGVPFCFPIIANLYIEISRIYQGFSIFAKVFLWYSFRKCSPG